MDAATTVDISGDEFVVSTPEEDPLALTNIGPEQRRCQRWSPVFNGYPIRKAMQDNISWSLSGADAKRFDIANIGVTENVDHDGDPDTAAVSVGRAALRWATADRKGPSFEAMDSADGDNVYLVTVTASDGSASKSQAVSVTVRNVEEDGKVTLSQLVPQEGIAITARLRDDDGNITGTEWQWYRGVTDVTLLRRIPKIADRNLV